MISDAPPRALLRGACVVVLISLLALCACSESNRAMPQPSAPPGATPYSGEGGLTTAAQLAMADLHSRLRAHYEKFWDVQRYAVPAAVNWNSITAHYAQALGPDWQVDQRYSEDAGTGYRSKVWSDGRRAVGIALIDGREAGAEQVLTVLVPENGE